jgi:hypothetical protein
VKKIIAKIIILAMMLTLTPVISASEAQTARTMTIFEIEGRDVKMTKGTAREFNARAGTRLHDGHTVSTGRASYAYIRLDETSMTKMDENSKIQVSKLSRNKLSISLLSGAVSVNAETQKGGEIMEVGGGNTALTVRGTLFVVEYKIDGVFVVYMLAGRGEVGGRIIEAGQIMRVLDNQQIADTKNYILEPFKIDDTLSIFVLETLLEYQDYLIWQGLFTEDDVPVIEELLERKYKELDARIAAEGTPPVIRNELIYIGESETSDTPDNTGGTDGETGGTDDHSGDVPYTPTAPPTTPPPTPPPLSISVCRWIFWRINCQYRHDACADGNLPFCNF